MSDVRGCINGSTVEERAGGDGERRKGEERERERERDETFLIGR